MNQKISFINFYIMPVVCVIGLLFECITALTFYKINKNSRRKIRIYNYLFVYSISDMIILLINIIYGVSNCGSYCSISIYVSQYLLKQYERIFKIFTCNALYTFNVLIELTIALDRFNKIGFLKSINKPKRDVKFLNRLSVKAVCLILLSLSFLINTPYLFIYKIDTQSERNRSLEVELETTVQPSNAGYSIRHHAQTDKEDSSQVQTIGILLKPDVIILNKYLPLKSIGLVFFLKDFLFLSFICLFNLLITVKLKENLNGKRQSSRKSQYTNTNSMPNSQMLTPTNPTQNETSHNKENGDQELMSLKSNSVNLNQQQTGGKIMKINFNSNFKQKEKRVSYMILLLCILFLMAHVPETFYRLKRKLNIPLINKSSYFDYYLIISNMITFISSYFKFFIYLYFIKTFFDQFKLILVKIKLAPVTSTSNKENGVFL